MYWSVPPEGIILKEYLCTSRITIWHTMPSRFKDGFAGGVTSTSWSNLGIYLI